MTSALLLSAWASSGVFGAVRFAAPGESKLAWAPVAMIFGPLWPSVAREQQSVVTPHAGETEIIDLTTMPPEVRWIHEDHRLIP